MAITKESFGAQVTNTSLSREGKSQNISDRAISLMDQMKDQQVDADYTLIHVSQREIIVEFQEGSAANPQNWTLKKKLFNAIAAFLIIVNCGISSALPSNAAPTIMSEFGQAGIDEWSSLPNAVYLMGYVVGSVIFSALSETIGRRPVLLGSFTVFVLGTLACALAPNWPSLLVFRAICGLAGSAPQTVIGGLYADIFFDARTRGRAMLSYTSASSFGPILGPIISGCSVQYGWRWTFRIDLILVGCTWLAALFTSETFGPVLLKRQASKLRQKWNSNCYFSRAELRSSASFTTTNIITRPMTMLIYEPIVLFTTIYMSIAYSLVFIYFDVYPIIFQGVYGFDIKQTCLALIPIGIGAMSSGLITFYYDTYYERNKKLGKSWTSSPELQRLPLSCLSGPCLTISIFWLAWTSKASIHWVVPMISGLLFGFGYQVVFTSLMTYVTDAYKIYSASALAASVAIRSIAGALLPFGVRPLYNAVGDSWATSILGFVSLACIPIPAALMYFGPFIRRRSPFGQRLLLLDNESRSTTSRTSTEV